MDRRSTADRVLVDDDTAAVGRLEHGLVHHRLRRADADRSASCHEQEPIAELGRESQVVRDQHDGEAGLAPRAGEGARRTRPDSAGPGGPSARRGSAASAPGPGRGPASPAAARPRSAGPARAARRSSTPTASIARRAAARSSSLSKNRRGARGKRPISTSSSTVCGKPCGTSCGTTAILAGHRGPLEAAQVAALEQDPAVRRRRTRERSRTRVVFPEALGPITPKVSPGRTSKDRSRMAKASAPGRARR